MSMHNPAHPGEVLNELLMISLDISVSDAAKHLNISRQTLSRVLNAKGGVTPEMALRLELAFKNPTADQWMRLQNAYDLWNTRKKLGALHVRPYHVKDA